MNCSTIRRLAFSARSADTSSSVSPGIHPPLGGLVSANEEGVQQPRGPAQSWAVAQNSCSGTRLAENADGPRNCVVACRSNPGVG